MWWVVLSVLIDIFVLWLGACMITFVPIAVVLGLVHGLHETVAYVRKCFRHAFFPSLEDDEEKAVDARVEVKVVPEVSQQPVAKEEKDKE